MRRVQRFAAAAAALALALGVLAAGTAQDGGGKAVLAEGERNQLIAHDAKAIQDLLAKGTLDAKATRKVKATALLIAAYAQDALNGPKGAQMATLRDTALKVLQAAENKNVDEAKKLAAMLTPDLKADPAAKVAPVPLNKHLDLELLMRVFSSERIGGFAIEKELEDLSESKDALTPAQLAKLGTMADKIAVVGRLTRSFDLPKTGEKEQTRQNWERFAEQMEAAATALAAATRGKQADAVRPALTRLTDNCTACHKVFRD